MAATAKPSTPPTVATAAAAKAKRAKRQPTRNSLGPVADLENMACADLIAKEATLEYTRGFGLPPNPSTFQTTQRPDNGSSSSSGPLFRLISSGKVAQL